MLLKPKLVKVRKRIRKRMMMQHQKNNHQLITVKFSKKKTLYKVKKKWINLCNWRKKERKQLIK
jgi:hypothetical protein